METAVHTYESETQNNPKCLVIKSKEDELMDTLLKFYKNESKSNKSKWYKSR